MKIKTATVLIFVVAIAYHVEKKVNPQNTDRNPATSFSKPVLPLNNGNAPIQLPDPDKNNSVSLLEEIEVLASCYEQDCGRPIIDPRTDYYSLGQDLKRKLYDYKNYVMQNSIRDSSVAELAKKFLAHSDGHVQEIALDLLSTQEISQDNLQAVLENIINGIDPNLIHQALLELQRYKSIDDQEKIRIALGNALIHGTPFVAAAIAERMNLVLTTQNISYFENLMVQLDPKSKIYISLKYSIQEFDQHLQAG